MKKLILFFAVAFVFIACRNEKTIDSNSAEDNFSDSLSYSYDSVKVYSKNFKKDKNNLGDTTNAIITYPVFSNTSLNTYIERKVTDYIGENEELVSYNYLAASFINGYDDFFKNNKETFQSWFLVIDIQVIN